MALTKVDISMLEDAGATGQILTSDGTNWTSAAAAGGGITSKVVTGTYNVATTGDLAVTGAGFTPSAVFALVSVGAGKVGSTGFCSSTVTDDGAWINRHEQAADTFYITSILWQLHTASGATATGIVKSYDSDGATFTKAISAGSPSGTATYFFMFIQ